MTSLEIVELVSCPRIGDISSFGALSGLRKLLVEDCGSVPTIKPLESCDSLEELYLIGTPVNDGDLSPMLRMKRLRKVAFPKNKAHSHTMPEINDLLARPGRPR